MGECFISRRGGEVKKLPVLNASYPADMVVWGEGGSATFKVVIDTPGVPAEYTYEWYRNETLVSWATGPTCTFYNLTQVATYSVYCIVTNKAGSITSRTATLTVRNPDMTYTYTGDHECIDDGDGNWLVKLKSSGVLTITEVGKNWDGKSDMFILGAGGAGVNTDGVAPGGGGYYETANSVYLRRGMGFSAMIGAGATAVESSGGASAMVGTIANGGGAAIAGGLDYIQCTMYKTTGSGIYVYSGTNVTTYSEVLASDSSVKLACDSSGNPILATITISGSTASAYKGKDGRYYRGGINSGWYVVYEAGTTGTGAAKTQVFGDGDEVSGPGETENASRPGQGGGTSGIIGGDGMVVIRNGRSTAIAITEQPQDATVALEANAIFTVTASGTDLTYQWQFLATSGSDAKDWSNTSITDATTNQLTVQAYDYCNGYFYRCIVTDGDGNQSISAPAKLTVQS